MLRRFRQYIAQLLYFIKAQPSAEKWLYENTSKPEQIELGLQRCKQVLKKLNLSHPNYKIITVAGTNGKGSTVQYLDSLLTYEGKKQQSVGRFTSPHLLRFNERIVIDGSEIGDSELLKAFRTIRKAADGIFLTYFEYVTLAAIYLFAKAKVDVAILEVGLGGRLDASNVVDADVAVITNIALDHQDWLGDDLDLIAREKAGIMRPGKPVVLAENDMPEALHEVAQELGAITYQLGKDYQLLDYSGEFRWKANIRATQDEFFVLDSSELSPFQKRNLAAAIAAVSFCDDIADIQQEAVTYAVMKGLPQGRLQLIKKYEHDWLLDVAHNPASVQVLCEYLNKTLSETKKKYSIVFSMLKDKDSQTCINLLSPYIKEWFVAPLDTPRAMSINDLSKLLVNESVEYLDTVEDACKKALAKSSSNPIIVCGSFYTVADALKYLEQS